MRLGDITKVYGLTGAAMLNKQAELLLRNYIRMAQDAEGRHVGLVTQYLNFSDAGYDSGLRDPADLSTGSGGAARPAYATWQSLYNL